MATNGVNGHKKPHVVSLGFPEWIGKDYLTKFKETYDFSVLEATNREETIERLPQHIKENGPVDAFIVRMGTPPFEPFDEALLKDLAGSCKIIASASAGFNEFDVDWMAENGIYFCNTIDAVAEATADMAVFLLLAILRNTTNGERSANVGSWRFGKAMTHPAKDPSGVTLGIVGMGTIGKV